MDVFAKNLKMFKSELSPVIDIELYEILEDWAIKSGFLTAPAASGKACGAHEGGLFDHSLCVMRNLCSFSKLNRLAWDREASPWIIGMFHDACKADAYLWDEEEGIFKWNTDQADKRHGEKSAAIVSALIPISCEEELCIRWHMGPYEGQKIWGDYHRAAELFPNILWTHHADMLASLTT